MKRDGKVERNANLDLLRIFSMFLIIFLHSIDHSGVLEKAEISSTWMYIYVQFTYAITQICVNCYVMLSGYFLVKSKFKLKKIVTLWMEVAFYSILIKLIFMILGMIPFSIVSLVSCLFPILTGRYWFVTIYVGLYCLSPFLNTFIYAMDKKQHTMLNTLLIGVFSIWISIHPVIAGMNSGRGWGLPWFTVLYFVAAWFRLYYKHNRINSLIAWAGGAICAIIMTIVRVISWKNDIGIMQQIVGNWYKYDSIFVLIMTVSTFVVFLNINIVNKKAVKWITTIAPATFGVYLIHAHAEVSPWIWETLALPEKMGNYLFPLLQLIYVCVIFLVCVLLDICRQILFKKIEKSNQINKICDFLTIKVIEKVNKNENISN